MSVSLFPALLAAIALRPGPAPACVGERRRHHPPPIASAAALNEDDEDAALEAFLGEMHPRIPPSELSCIVSEGERRQGVLASSTLASVRGILDEHGVVCLKGVWNAEPSLVASLTSRVDANFKACTEAIAQQAQLSPDDAFAYRQIVHRSLGRYDMCLDADVALCPPLPAEVEDVLGGGGSDHEGGDCVARSGWRNQLLASLLGPDYRVNFLAALYSRSGAAEQQPHVDGGHLFQSTHGDGHHAPLHALQLFLPLCEMELPTGPTEFWPGSHRARNQRFAYLLPSTPLPASPGDAIVFDFRVVHRGMANRSPKWRPILYQTCSRSWFTDDFNFPPTSLSTFQSQEVAGDAFAPSAQARPPWREGGKGERTGFVARA